MAKVFLRVASVVAIVQFVAHTFLLLSYVPRHGIEETAIVEAMRSHSFDFGGSRPHSYWEMYLGYGLLAAINCLIEGILFWYLSTLGSSARGVNGIVVLFLLANATYAVLVWRYFFFVPLVADILIAICLTIALLTGQRGMAYER